MPPETAGVLEARAEQLARVIHEGQRRHSHSLYIGHLEGVVRLLKQVQQNGSHDIVDELAICSAWLHRSIGLVTLPLLDRQFGKEFAARMYILTRNVSEEAYVMRMIDEAPAQVQIVRLADITDDLSAPYTNIPLHRMKIMLRECRRNYIPLAKKLCPYFYDTIMQNAEKLNGDDRALLLEH
jgi:(p)ppGpp synthase/HD superfamily hydrolase